MEDYLDIDQILPKADDVIEYLESEIDKVLDSDSMNIAAHGKKKNLQIFKDLVKASRQLNKRHSLRAVLINDFVEGMRHKVLDDDQLPEDTFEVQREDFNKLFTPVVEDYDKIVEDYFS